MRARCAAVAIAVAFLWRPAHLVGQNRGAPPPAPPAPAAGSAKSSAPVDLTGYWVSFVSEDWRWRMLTPPKGDYQSVPLTPEGRRVADAWDPAADAQGGMQCKAYGAAAIMRVPGRLHLTWRDDSTLQVDTDAGMQTRLFQFKAAAAPSESSWQGFSVAQWDRPARGANPAVLGSGGSLRVVTTNMRAGYLRRNGVPYSSDARLTEYFDVEPLPGGGVALLVTAVVEDPRNLQVPFIVSSQFKKETDGSKWDPIPCSAPW